MDRTHGKAPGAARSGSRNGNIGQETAAPAARPFDFDGLRFPCAKTVYVTRQNRSRGDRWGKISLYTQYQGPMKRHANYTASEVGHTAPRTQHRTFLFFVPGDLPAVPPGVRVLGRNSVTPTTQALDRTREFEGNLSPTRPGLLPLRPCRNRQNRRIDSQTTRRRNQPQTRPRSQPQTRPNPRW